MAFASRRGASGRRGGYQYTPVIPKEKRKVSTSPSELIKHQEGIQISSYNNKLPKLDLENEQNNKNNTSKNNNDPNKGNSALPVEDLLLLQNSQPTADESLNHVPNHSNSITETVEDESRKNKNKQPPIVIEGVEPKTIIDLLKKNNLLNHSKIKNFSSNKCNIISNNTETYLSIKKALNNENIQFYSFTPRQQKPKSLVLKGLHTGTSCEEILEELNGLNIENVNILKVTPLRMRSKKDNTNNNASTFIVQISADSKNSNLTNIHSLIHQVVK